MACRPVQRSLIQWISNGMLGADRVVRAQFYPPYGSLQNVGYAKGSLTQATQGSLGASSRGVDEEAETAGLVGSASVDALLY